MFNNIIIYIKLAQMVSFIRKIHFFKPFYER